jgi:peptide/nickel transport system ATP-binding protein
LTAPKPPKTSIRQKGLPFTNAFIMTQGPQFTVLQVQNLRISFETHGGYVHAVDDVSLSIGEGQAVGLVGETGSGKTTTALSVLRMLPTNARVLGGEILLNGEDLLTLSQEKMRNIRGKQIAAVFQDPLSFLNPVLRVGDQVGEVLRIHKGASKEEARREVVELFKLVQIPGAKEVVNYYPHQLSGGMRQRVMIAAAIGCSPQLIIFDEPTTALDATIQAQIIEIIKRLKKSVGMSILLITHDLGIVAEICDYVYVMYAGRIVENAGVNAIYKNPRHPYLQGLLRSNLSILKSGATLEAIEGNPPDMHSLLPGCRFHPRCPHAMDICRTDEPPSFPAGEEHNSRCWLEKPGGQS